MSFKIIFFCYFALLTRFRHFYIRRIKSFLKHNGNENMKSTPANSNPSYTNKSSMMSLTILAIICLMNAIDAHPENTIKKANFLKNYYPTAPSVLSEIRVSRTNLFSFLYKCRVVMIKDRTCK